MPRISSVKSEQELTAPVDLCLPDGKLNRNAIGWSRRSLVRANLRGWGRNKRFEYWCITTPTHVIAVNVSHSDYRVTYAAFCLDLTTLESVADVEVRWLPPRAESLPELSGTAPTVGRGKRVQVVMTPNETGTALRATGPRLDIDLQVIEPEGHESMGVVVPWSDRLFQYTRKDNCLRVGGRIVVDGVEYPVERETAWATLDHGRGRWPYSIVWNWGSGSGITDGHEIGLQFGAKWTDGTPSTENSVRIDGRVEKISEDVEWGYDRSDWMAPWTITGSRVDLEFTPVFDRYSNFNRVIVLSREHQVFGHFNGEIVSKFGERIAIENVFGWVEEVTRRW